jgi:hypothetical protein
MVVTTISIFLGKLEDFFNNPLIFNLFTIYPNLIYKYHHYGHELVTILYLNHLHGFKLIY